MLLFFFFKQKTAYEMRISDWSSDVCSSDLHVRKAEAPIIEALQASGALVHLATITHSYPHCWRHKTPLIFRATPQWFVAMDRQGLRDDALKAIAATDWIPDWGENRIREMVAGRPDWCLSRQRYWGVPLAVFTDQIGRAHV